MNGYGGGCVLQFVKCETSISLRAIHIVMKVCSWLRSLSSFLIEEEYISWLRLLAGKTW